MTDILNILNTLATSGNLTNVVSRQAIKQATELYQQDGLSALPELLPHLKLVVTQVQNCDCYINPTAWQPLMELYEMAKQAHDDEI